MDKTLISKRIQQYRRFERLSQEALADMLEVSDTYIRKLESGERTPSLSLIMSLANVLNVTPNHLLLPASHFDDSTASNIMRLLDDCTHTEFVILYENMMELKVLLRKHYR